MPLIITDEQLAEALAVLTGAIRAACARSQYAIASKATRVTDRALP